MMVLSQMSYDHRYLDSELNAAYDTAWIYYWTTFSKYFIKNDVMFIIIHYSSGSQWVLVLEIISTAQNYRLYYKK